MRFPRSLTALLAAGCLFLAAPLARADDAPPPDDLKAQLKAQVEKILKLMRENEAALLEASTAGGAAPKGPDVKIPEPPTNPGGTGTPPPSGDKTGSGSAGGANGGGGNGSGTAGTRGDEIKKKLEELIKGQQQGASKIPDEIANLVKMIPT
jgi:hypothetical protein